MIRTFCDRCGRETTGEKHGAISGTEDAEDNGDGTLQAVDCFDIVCDNCFTVWRVWMKNPTLADFATLASAMKKVLPAALLADVVAHLDPLTPFLTFLRETPDTQEHAE